MKITLSHGSGGKATSELIDKIFAKHFYKESYILLGWENKLAAHQ